MSEDNEKEQPIIVIKKGGKHGGHHGGAWKVAYADFVTAMMAFFLVMWLVNQAPEVKEAVQGYFRDPINYGKGAKPSIIDGGAGVMKNGGLGDVKEREETIEEQMQREMEELAERIRGTIDEMPGLSIIKDNVDIEITREGLRIQLIEGSDEVTFFKTGSAVLSMKGELIMKTIAMELKRLPNQLVIEGHTDGSDLDRSRDYTNWELSADRANSARRAMMENQLQPDQVYQVRGYADRKPRIKDNPFDPRNRRITILVLNRLFGQEDTDDEFEPALRMSSK